MKISLVTPCYNAARFIGETLASVLAQEFAGLEYIVVDGGSTDGTAEIISQKRERLAWWVSERDEGQVSALNKGLARSTGEVLGFLNADDLLLPGALQAVADAFAANPDVDIVYGRVEWIDAAGVVTGQHAGEISTLADILDLYRVWWGKRQWVQPEVFFRRKLWERVGAFDERFHLAFDFDYWVRCFLAEARVHRIPQCLVRFRLHEDQKSNARRKAATEIREIVERALDSDPPIGSSLKRRLKAQLSYDLYQSRTGTAGNDGRGWFGGALVRHPEWVFYVPEVRRRIRAACVRRLAAARKGPTATHD